MRALLIFVIAVGVAWSGYWFYGAQRETDAVEAWFRTRDAARYADMNLAGFPNRYDTSIARPQIETGPVGWTTPMIQLLRLSYRPDHYILAFDTRQDLTLNGLPMTLANGQARASAVFVEEALDRFVLTVRNPLLLSGLGWSLSASSLNFAVRRGADGYEIGLDAPGLRVTEGTTDLHIEGRLTLSGGIPAGDLVVTVSDPTAFARIAQTIGLPAGAPPLTVSFRDGRMLWNGVPIASAPRLP